MDYDFSSYTHDVERFISDLGKLSTIKDYESNNTSLLNSRLTSINSLSRALSAKTSFLRYLEIINSDGDIGIEFRRHKLVPIVERVSYAARHLVYLHHGKNINRPLNLERSTYGEFYGPDFFEFIPFALIDNSIKYNIRDGMINISVHESNGVGFIDISSIGPLIDEDEEELIFLKGFRGREARKTTQSGRGIGLFHARQAMRDSFKGDIRLLDAARATSFEINGIRFAQNTFRIELPLI